MGFDTTNVVTINCDVCVEADASTLDAGHLKFPQNFHGTLTTLFMSVQEKLTMSCDRYHGCKWLSFEKEKSGQPNRLANSMCD
eukprot:7592492-Ditylum_brightwellii.AAC.1